MAAHSKGWMVDLPENILEDEQKPLATPNHPNIKRSLEVDHPEDYPTKRRPVNSAIPIDNGEVKLQIKAETPRARLDEIQNEAQQQLGNREQEEADWNPHSVGQLEEYFAYSPPLQQGDQHNNLHIGSQMAPQQQPLANHHSGIIQQMQATPHHPTQLQRPLQQQNYAPQMHQMQPNPSHSYAQLHPLNAPPQQSQGYQATMVSPRIPERNPFQQQQVYRVEPAQQNSYSTPYQPMQGDRWTMQQRGNFQPLLPFNFGIPFTQQPSCFYNGMNSGATRQGAIPVIHPMPISNAVPSTTPIPKSNPRQIRRAKPVMDPKQFSHEVPFPHENSTIVGHAPSRQLMPPSLNSSLRFDEYGKAPAHVVIPTPPSRIPSINENAAIQDLGVLSESKKSFDKEDSPRPIVFSKANSWIGKKRCVEVKVEEIERRMGSPEFQTLRMIQRLTRHARTSLNSFEHKLLNARIDIEKDINSDPARSTIEMLLEADALTLGLDFNKLTSNELSKSTLASIATCADDRNVQIIGEHAQHIRDLLASVKKHLLRIGREPGNIVEQQLYDPNCPDSRAVLKFSHETHGFGPRVAITVIERMMSVVDLISTTAGKQMINKANSELFKSISDGKEIENAVLKIQVDDSEMYDEAVLPRIGYDIEPIQITRGEVRRRIQGPEKFTPTLLCAFLRKEKVAGSLPNLRLHLHNIGIPFDEKRKTNKSLPTCSWTSLSEKESMDLARETGDFLMQLNPSKEMMEKASEHPHAAAWIAFMADSIERAMNKIGATPEERRVETVADEHLLRFALITHHFGHNFVASVMAWLQKVFR